MESKPLTLPVFAIERHRLTTDGIGVTTLVGAYGCPLQCRYCLNPHAWNPDTLKKCTYLTPEELFERVKIDQLYFLATNGGVTFGGGEALLHANFIKAFRKVCGKEWNLTVETSLNVPGANLLTAMEAVDNYIVDIKDLNPEIYENYTGMPVDRVFSNLTLLSESIDPARITVRVPAIPKYNTEEAIASSVNILKNMGFTNLDLFTYIIR